MKKLLLFSLILSFGLVGFSQESPTVKDKYKLAKFGKERVNRATDNATNFNNPVSLVKSSGALAPSETQIGITEYDLFSNFNTGNRFWVFEDGTMAGVWMYGTEDFSDRGTGYNYYDGTEWGPEPTVRIEDEKCGWPNITAWGPGGEIGVAHSSTGLEIIQRETKGTGEWTQTYFPGPEGIEEDITWPRMITSGENNEYIHLIVNTYGAWQGQPTTNLYSRSDDGGATWNPHNVVLPEWGADHYLEITQDKSVMASKGNTVCILYVDAYSDLFYLRSDDNMDSWEKNIVWQHPIPFYSSGDPIDSIFVPDFSGHIAIDNLGHAHVVFGITRYINDGSATDFFDEHEKWSNGIAYWNDMMDPFSSDYDALAPPGIGYANSELVQDVSYIGWMQDVDGDGVVTLAGAYPIRTHGMCTTPCIHVDDQGRRFVIFSALTETQEVAVGSLTVNYKRIWARAYDGGGGWGEFLDLTADYSHVFDDCVYPMIGNNSDGHIHYIYQADFSPGNSLDDDHAQQENRWIYGSLPKTDLMTGISDKELIDDSPLSQNFPNPFSKVSTINFRLEKAAELSLVVSNITGQKVMEIHKGHVPAQTHTFTIDAANLKTGIYFYTVTAGDSQFTRKMIVE